MATKNLTHNLRYFYLSRVLPFLQRCSQLYLIALAEFATGAGLRWEQVRWLLPSSIWESNATHVWVRDGLVYSLIRQTNPEWDRLPESTRDILQKEWYCGYVRYAKCPFIYPLPPLRASGNSYARMSDYVPVHGGITFERGDIAGYVIGFDCNHYRDHYNPMLQNRDWLANEVHNMRLAIDLMQAEGYERRYVAIPEGEFKLRAELISSYHDHLQTQGIEFNLTNNFMAMVNAISGRL